MFSFRKAALLCFLVVFLSSFKGASGAVSYLLVQGEFDSGSAGLETYKWQVNYDPGQLTTGLDLLIAVFGNPTASGKYNGGLSDYFTSTSTYGSAGYIDFGGGSLFTESFTLSGMKVAQDTSYDPGWNSYLAGGSGVFHGGSYLNSGSWIYADDGITSRQLADGSFDSWVYGGTFPAAAISGDTGNNSPDVLNFTNATQINLSSTPEPGRPVLLVIGAGCLLMRRRRMTGTYE